MATRAHLIPIRAALLGLLLSAAWTSTAWAHPLVDHGYRLYEGADFRGALIAFEAAEAATDLTREDLAHLLEGRALAQLALNQEAEMEATLRQLASVEPSREMGRAIPPPMRDAFARVSRDVVAPIGVEARAEAMPGGARVLAEVRNDPSGVVREVRIHGRPLGEIEWTSGTGTDVSVVAASGATIELYAEAIGPGGAIVAQAGSEAAPLTATTSSVDEGEDVLEEDDDGGSLLVPILIGAGALVVVAAVVIIVVVASSGGQSDDTQFSAPTWPM